MNSFSRQSCVPRGLDIGFITIPSKDKSPLQLVYSPPIHFTAVQILSIGAQGDANKKLDLNGEFQGAPVCGRSHRPQG